MSFDSPLYPVNLVVAGQRCLLVGGGRVAVHKASELLACGAELTVVAPRVADALRDDPRCVVHERPYETGDVDGCRLVVIATGVAAVSAQVTRDADAAGVWVNSADDPENCTFTLPARIRQGPLLVTFSTSGASPAVASWLRRRYAAEFGPEYAQLIELMAEVREELKASGRSTEDVDWQSALDSGMLERIRLGQIDEARASLRRTLAQ